MRTTDTMATLAKIVEAARDVRDAAKEDSRNANDHAERAASYAVASAFARFIDSIQYIEKQEAEATIARIEAA